MVRRVQGRRRRSNRAAASAASAADAASPLRAAVAARGRRRRARAARAARSVDAAAPAPDGRPPGAGAKRDAELAARGKAVQDLEAQVIELRRIIEEMDRSRASVDDLRRRLDEMEARLGENDRRDEALASGAGREAALFKFRDDGFTMRSPNGRFLLVPHLRLQTVYTGALASRGTMDTAAPDVSGFTLPHAELILEGHVGSRLFAYRLQLDAAQSPTINDAYVQIGTRAPLRRARRPVQDPLRPAALDLERRAGVRRHLGADAGVLARPRHRPDGHRAGRSRAGSSTSSPSPTAPGAGRPQRQHRSRVRGARGRRAVGAGAARRRATSNGTRARGRRSAWPGTTTWCRPTSSRARAIRTRTPTSTATAASTTSRSGRAAPS